MKRALCLLSLVLAGCASEWHTSARAPVRFTELVFVTDPSPACGKPAGALDGCTVFSGDRAQLQVKRGLAPEKQRCVISHEGMHAAGFDHDRRSNSDLCAVGVL